MYRFANIIWFLMAFALLSLSACGNGTPTADPSLAYTQIWQTVEAAQTQTGLFASPTPAVTNTPPASMTPRATNTPLLTATLLPGVLTATSFTLNTFSTPAGTALTPVGTQNASCDNMLGVADVTYPDNSVVPAGVVFIKTWSIKNLGPCTWDKNYKLIYGWPAAGPWNTTHPTYLTANVLPGETVEVSVTLKAPTSPGTYSAHFRMQNSKGYNFGPDQYLIVVVK
jgi:Ig-like domain from next to BRCA1 gene